MHPEGLWTHDKRSFRMLLSEGLLDVVMPGYIAEGKAQLSIAVGCTGGQHRSVVIANTTANYLQRQGYHVTLSHRDLALAEKGSAPRP